MVRAFPLSVWVWVVLLVTLAGCNGGSDNPGAAGAGGSGGDKPSGEFESDLPGALGGNRSGLEGAGGAGGASAPTLDGGAVADQSGDPSRAIVEADVIQLDGDRLYTLSRVAGLGIIDVSNPDQLRMLGRYRDLPGQPFEMYLRDGVVVAMFSDWGQYVEADDGTWQWVQTSKVVALDAVDANHIARIGEFDLPGSVSDSRIVGDVMYVVGYQDGYCWGCEQNAARTTVLSLDVSDPRAMQQVDALSFEDADNQWGWSKRSITVTEQRMYVAGPEYGTNQPQGSTIQVIDISDPSGQMVEGASVEVAGQITSRWQMDEYEGVLRVISQPPQWDLSEPPHVQTFRVVSSDELTPLGAIELVLPRPEQLQSVRFDGERGYAITFERTDPLFTIDLSDPANPVQRGELEMPGWLYHMVPRGDRLLGLGYDQGNSAGSITVSVFDVSDLATPTMIDRVNFGGDWANLPEDQDRIHKAFKVLDEAGLILVPFAGYDWDENNDSVYCGGSYSGGVQLVDFEGDELTLRGKAAVDGSVRRALLIGERLLTISDERVETFDIDNRAQPEPTERLLLARNVERAFKLDNGSVARFAIGWWDSAPSLDFVSASEADEPNASLGALDLRGVFGNDDVCQSSVWVRDAFVRGDLLEIIYEGWESTSLTGGKSVYGLAIVDGSDPSAPELLSNTTWAYGTNWWRYDGYYGYGYYGEQRSLARTDHAIVTLETSYEYTGNTSTQHHRLRVVDVSDPRKPINTVLPLQESHSYSGLVADGDSVLTSHFEVKGASTGRARFYLDRFDVSDPTKLVQATPINIPGALMHLDADSGDLVTSELRRAEIDVDGAEPCYKAFAWAEYVPDSTTTWDGPGRCIGYTQRLHLVSIDKSTATLEDTLQLEDDEQVRSVAAGDGVLFASMGFGGNYYHYGLIDCFGPCGFGGGTSAPSELLTLGGFGKGSIEAGRVTVENQNNWYGFWGSPGLFAHGTRALMMSHDEVAIIDASDPSDPELVRTTPLYSAPYAVHVTDDGEALISLGIQGVQWVDVE